MRNLIVGVLIFTGLVGYTALYRYQRLATQSTPPAEASSDSRAAAVR